MNRRFGTNAGVLGLMLLSLCAAAAAQDVDFGKYVTQAPAYSDIDQGGTGPMRAELAKEIEKVLTAGDGLAPVSMQRGLGGDAVMWGNPAETVYTLCQAADLLPADLAARALAHAKMLVAKYPPWTVGWTEEGAQRELWPVDESWTKKRPKVRTAPEMSNLYIVWFFADKTGDWKTIQANWPAISGLYNGSFKELKATAAGKADWSAGSLMGKSEIQGKVPGAVDIRPGTLQIKVPLDGKVEETLKDDGQGGLIGDKGGKGKVRYKAGEFIATLGGKVAAGDTILRATFTHRAPRTYGGVAGMIGYARMAGHLRTEDAPGAATVAVNAVKEASDIGFSGMYKMAFGLYGKKNPHDWMYPVFHVRRDGDFTTSVLFCPEIGRLLGDTARDEVRAHVESYLVGANARAWYLQFGDQVRDAVNTRLIAPVAGGEGTGGENSFMPPDFGWTFYMLNAYVIKSPPEQLKLWLDVPWARTGDLYHLQRLTAAIRAYGKERWETMKDER